MVEKRPDYDRSVFINCPFDAAYAPIFDAIVFAVVDCGFQARCAKESADASQTRIHKIYDMIAVCRLGIHDLSRTELDQTSALPRFNMPLELGIFLGAKFIAGEEQRRKQCLILDVEPYRYQKYISDVSGQDIATHSNDPRLALTSVRGWLATVSKRPIPGAAALWDRYNRFKSELPEECHKESQRPEDLTYLEYVRYVDAFRELRDDQLYVGGGESIINPSRQDIRNALRRLRGGEDSFAIYDKSGSGLTYIQTLGSPKDGYPRVPSRLRRGALPLRRRAPYSRRG